MVPQEQYDILIDYVESAVSSRGNDGPEEQTIDAQRIANEAIRATQCTRRQVDEIFKFTENQTFIEYIQERLLMYVCKVILNQQKYSLDDLMAITGYNDDKALYRAFRKQFGVTPSEIYNQKREDLYKAPKHWIDLSNIEREVVTKEIEVVKEVPVFNTVVKIDRKPFIFVTLLVVGFFLGFFIKSPIHTNKYWDGDYAIYNMNRVVNEKIAPGWENEICRISNSGKRVEILSEGNVLKTYKSTLKDGVISWDDSEGNHYEGPVSGDGSITIFKNDSAHYYWLAKPADLDEWAKLWDGEYDLYQTDKDGHKIRTSEFASIFSKSGSLSIAETLDDGKNQKGWIIYFGPKYLIAVFPGTDLGIVKCIITGTDTIDICSQETGELLRVCIRIDSHNND